jgi:integral membrane protein (TIGR03766 family)
MRQKILTGVDRSVLVLFSLLFGITVISAGLSVNLKLTDVTLWSVGVLLIGGGSYVLTQTNLWLSPGARQLVVSWSLFIAAIVGQAVVAYQFHPAIGFDAGAVHDALRHADDINLIGYFSQNINNLPILMLFDSLAGLFHTKSWFFFDVVSIVCVDLALLINVGTMTLVQRDNWRRLLWLETVFMTVFPWILVPYTDTVVMPVVALLLLAAAGLLNSRRWSLRAIWALALVLAGVLAYFIKPSAMIPAIAVVLMIMRRIVQTQLWRDWRKMGQGILLAIVCVATVVGTVQWGQHQIDQQTIIRVNKGLAIPPIHFMSMGVAGDGGYNERDALKMATLPKRTDKVAYSKAQLLKRLRQRGVLGYVAFLVRKQGLNTADGSFAWLREGHFFANPNDVQPWRGIEAWLTPSGRHLKDFQFLAQIWWLFLLLIICAGLRRQTDWQRLLQLGLIGAFMYLLLFEGGRSRYVIQFLPLFFLLAGSTADIAWQALNRLGQQSVWLFFGKETK